jgi:hypothetical protein
VNVDELLAIARQYQVPIEEKQAWWKIGAGPRRVYVAKGKEASRIHLTGLEEMSHAAITPLSESEASERHLGRVRGEILVSRHAGAVVLDAFTKALRMIQPGVSVPESSGPGPLPQPANSDFVVVRLTSAELLDRLRAARVQIQAGLPPGVELDEEDTVRVLLHEALTARERNRKRG